MPGPEVDPQAACETLRSGAGFVVLHDLLSDAELDACRSALDRCYEAARAAGTLVDQRGRLRVRVIGDRVLRSVACHPVVIDVARRLLGPTTVVGGFSGHTLTPGAAPQGVHIDYPYPVLPTPFPAAPLQLQAIWALTDFTAANGATCVMPGSQRRGCEPDPEEFAAHSVVVECAAGSVILSHGALWHDTSTNGSDAPRHALLGSYTPFWVRSIEGVPEDAQAAGVDPETEEGALLGLAFRATLLREVVERPHRRPGR